MLIVFANTKGGVGKSTLAVHLAVWLHDRGAKVALLDADRQLSASQWVKEAESKITVATAETGDDVLSIVPELTSKHDFVVADGPGGLNETGRTLLVLGDLAIFPIGPSILDLRSVTEATRALKYAQQLKQLNGGSVQARIVLNCVKTRDRISQELSEAAPSLGVDIAKSFLRDLQAYREAAQQGTVVTRMGYKAKAAQAELTQLFVELMTDKLAFLDIGSTKEKEVVNERKKIAG
jgi:chromosome partitioning protein